MVRVAAAMVRAVEGGGCQTPMVVKGLAAGPKEAAHLVGWVSRADSADFAADRAAVATDSPRIVPPPSHMSSAPQSICIDGNRWRSPGHYPASCSMPHRRLQAADRRSSHDPTDLLRRFCHCRTT